ncbi:hypothetical protein FQZ97_684390 [compost metagenome]
MSGNPLPERIIEGSPRFTTWKLEENTARKSAAGVWEATPGAYVSMKGDTWEFCSIVSGVSELTEDGQPTVRLQPGSNFIMRPGFKGVWRVIETTRKLWVTIEAPV